MIKKIFLLSVVVSQLTISCSNDDNSNDSSDQSLEGQISEISKLPYSSLKPEQQKVKLEADANEMLVKLDKSKTSGAIEAIENLGNLLSINTVDILNGKNENKIEDILNVSGVYGIYTWDNTKQIWVKTTSTTELKFVFPAKKTQTANNASLSSNSVSSTIKVKLEDTYNWQTGTTINDYFYLPTSVNAVLTINNVKVATFDTNAKYTGTVETPDEASYKMVLDDGYTFEMSGKRVPSEAKSSFTFEGKNIIEFNSGSTANIDELLKDNYLNKYLGTANGLIRLMDNFVITVNSNNEGLANDEAALEKSLTYPDYNSKTYYTDISTYNKSLADGEVLLNNKNVKMALVSTKDGTKIADVIQKSVKGYSWKSYTGVLVQEYDEVLYLKFNDNTEVEMSTYFSTGFENLNTKFEDFIKAFDRN